MHAKHSSFSARLEHFYLISLLFHAPKQLITLKVQINGFGMQKKSIFVLCYYNLLITIDIAKRMSDSCSAPLNYLKNT